MKVQLSTPRRVLTWVASLICFNNNILCVSGLKYRTASLKTVIDTLGTWVPLECVVLNRSTKLITDKCQKLDMYIFYQANGLDYFQVKIAVATVRIKRKSRSVKQLIHWNNQILQTVTPRWHLSLFSWFQAMEKLVDEGLVRAIGLSNVNKDQLKRIYEKARIKPANLQVTLTCSLSQLFHWLFHLE